MEISLITPISQALLKIFLPILLLFFSGCARPQNQVVVYTSLDQTFSEPILQEFEQKTGIRLKAVYDVEATKTTGLVNRLIAEKNNPQADIFWNSEIARTLLLKKKGVLAPYASPSAKDIPAQFKDKENYWTGFAGRVRVLIYNTDLVGEEEKPKSIFELTDERWRGKVALANPLFGTTATHCAALFVKLGDKKALKYFKDLKANDVKIVDGNATSKDMVAAGRLWIGFTDTDDVNVAINQGKPVAMIFPDKRDIGTFLIPNTVCLIKNAPNPENGKRFIDFLLSKEIESKLAHSESMQIPLRNDVARPKTLPDLRWIKAMRVDYEAVAERMEDTAKILQDLFLR